MGSIKKPCVTYALEPPLLKNPLMCGVSGAGFGVWGLGFGAWGLGFGVWGLGFRV